MESQSISPKSHVIDKLARALLATTCLTGASGVAAAATIIEGQAPAPADFGNTFGAATLLPAGTTVVQGAVNFATDDNDFVEFQNLAAGQSFTASAFYTVLGIEGGIDLNIFDSSQNLLGSESLEGSGAIVTGTIPNDGLLFAQLNMASEQAAGYELDLTANGQISTPEPSTLATGGLALAGALLLRRKRSQKTA